MKADLGNHPGSHKQDHRLEIDQHKNPASLPTRKSRFWQKDFAGTQRSAHRGWGLAAVLRPRAVGSRGLHQKESILPGVRSAKFSPHSYQKAWTQVSWAQGRHTGSTRGVVPDVRILAFCTHTVSLKRCTMNALSAQRVAGVAREDQHSPNPTHTTYHPPLT